MGQGVPVDLDFILKGHADSAVGNENSSPLPGDDPGGGPHYSLQLL